MMTIRKNSSNAPTEAFGKNNSNTAESILKQKVLTTSSPFHILEAYKTLRTNIIFSLPDPGCKKIIVTSSQAGEGKSINCLNIAISFGENGSRVLVIDCDLRKPNIARTLDVKAKKGLSNALVNLCGVDEIITHSDYSNLDIIFSGDIPPNPSELLGSVRFEELLSEIESRYDYIFLDSPPVNVVADAVVLSKIATGVILVARQGLAEKDSFGKAINQLEFAGAKIIGTVLNDAMQSGGSYYYKKHGYGGYTL